MFLLFGGLFFLLLGRLLFIQFTGEAGGKALAALAEARYAKESILKAERGKILDRNGEVIVSDTLSYKLVAVVAESATKGSKIPRHVVDTKKTAEVLAEYLSMDQDDIKTRLDNAKENEKYQTEFGKAGRDISHDTVQKIKEHGLPGLVFFEENKRFYPNGVFASYLIGFAVKEEEEAGKFKTVGKMGIESTFDKELTGTDGKVNFETDKWGFVLPKSEKAVQPAKDGHEIHLTIDKTIQNFVEDAMVRVDEEYSPDKMLAIVADPKTGAILAMSQRPAFNPTTREGLTTNWLNDAVENTIEPGSTFKMFTLAAAIEENVWNPNAEFKSGQYTLLDRTIRDHHRGGWGTISFLEGFQRSSNVSMAYLLERMGDQPFLEHIRNFGFGEKTGIDLPNEAAGIILDRNPSERLTTTYGQGSTVTPIQMIQAASAIANDGVMMKPYVIEKIINPNTGKVIQDVQPEEKGRPISSQTAHEVREVLASTVTSSAGTGRRFALNGYSVGGKTGTAEIPMPGGGYYSNDNNYLYSFLGMAPIEDPQLITYIIVQNPKLKVGEIGSDPVSKLFNSIMEHSLKYMNIVPHDDEMVELVELGQYVGKGAAASIVELSEKGFKPVLIGSEGKITTQYPSEKVKLAKGSTVLLKTDGDITLPNFTGWSKKMVLSYKMISGLDIRMNGGGYVTVQSLSAGTEVKSTEPIVLQLQTPSELYKVLEEEEEIITGG